MNKEEKEIDLKAIFLVLVSGWKLILILTLVVFLAAFSITKFAISPLYSSNVQMYVYNNNRDTTNITNLTQADLTTSQKLVNTYIVILQNDEVLEKVSDIITKEFSSAILEENLSMTMVNGKKVIPSSALKRAITFSPVNETEVLNIQAITKDAELSAAICTAVTDVAPDVLTRVVKAGSVETIGTAKVSGSPSYPNVNKNSLIGALIGLVLSVFILILRYMLDNTIKNSDDIKIIVDIPVLGEIPDFDSQIKSGYVYGK